MNKKRIHLNRLLVAIVVAAAVGVAVYVQNINERFDRDRQLQVESKSHEVARMAEALGSLEDDILSTTFNISEQSFELVQASLTKASSLIQNLSNKHDFETVDSQTQALEIALPLMDDLAVWLQHGFDHQSPDSVTVARIAGQRVYLARVQLEQIYSRAREKTAFLLTQQSKQLKSFGGTVVLLMISFLGVMFLAGIFYSRNRQAEKDLWKQQALVSDSLNNINEGFVLINPQGVARMVNSSLHRMCRQLAYELEIGHNYESALKKVLDAKNLIQVGDDGGSSLEPNQVTDRQAQSEYYTHSGDYLRVNERDTNDGGKVITFTDITDLKNTEDKLQRQANYDYLTGIANRSYYVQRLHEALSRARRHGHKVALMQFDLDKFKQVNDTLGHAVGDELLIETAKRIKRNLRDVDLAARIGGDEFAAIIDQINDQEEALSSAERIMQELYQKLQIEGIEIDFSASIGIAVFPDHANDIESLMQHADIACYRAKASGRNNCQLYGSDMKVQAMELMTLESRLRKAVEKDQLSIEYQSHMRLETNEYACVEVFSRWHDEKLGEVSPAKFIPIAEKNGLITVLGDQILGKVFAQLREWEAHGLTDIKVAINISQRQLFQPNLPATIDRLSEEFSVDPGKVLFEITESSITSDAELASERLNELAERGISFVLDDYGKGNSSLHRIVKLPISALKIDGSFIQNLTADDESRDIVQAMISSASTLNLETIAECVETPEQVELLRDLGCTTIQGYFVGEPQPADQVLLTHQPDPLDQQARKSA